jgi:DNA replication protein DnaC
MIIPPCLPEEVIILNKKNLEEIIRRLREMRLPEMANQLILMNETGELHTISAEALIQRLTQEELLSRKNNTIERYRKMAKLSQPAAELSDIEYKPERKINEAVISQLSDDQYILKHRNVIIMGACGTGKSFIANALASNACRMFHTAYYCRMFEILEMTNSDRLMNGDSYKSIRKLVKPDVLVIDDFMNQKLTDRECIDLFKIMEYREGKKSTIVASQLEPKEWHKNLGGNILADSILDRITSNAFKLTLSGDSMRKTQK